MVISPALDQGYPQVRVFGESRAGRHHADNDTRDFVDSNRLPNDGRVLAVTVLPETMSEHHDGGCISALILYLEIPPQYRLPADYREAIGRHLHADVTFRESAVIAP